MKEFVIKFGIIECGSIMASDYDDAVERCYELLEIQEATPQDEDWSKNDTDSLPTENHSNIKTTPYITCNLCGQKSTDDRYVDELRCPCGSEDVGYSD